MEFVAVHTFMFLIPDHNAHSLVFIIRNEFLCIRQLGFVFAQESSSYVDIYVVSGSAGFLALIIIDTAMMTPRVAKPPASLNAMS